jgi:hypothetical protein
MNDFVFRKIWLPIDVNGDAAVLNAAGRQALMYKGGEVMFCLALFNRLPAGEDAGEFLNHARIATFLLKIRQTNYTGTLLLDSSAGATVEIDPTVTEDQFKARTKAPIQIYCPSAITAIAAGTLYMTFIGATTDAPAQPDPFGRGVITCEDIGIGAADSVAPAGAQAATTDMLNAIAQQCVKYGKNPAGKTFTLVSPNNTRGRKFGVSDDGKEIANLERY